MTKKAVFFDADGTVCDLKEGVPQSTIDAITQLVKNGHEAWLCTGRCRAMIGADLEQIPFTGMISSCGATIEKNGVVLYNNEVPLDIAEKSVEILRRNGMIPVMEGYDYMYYDKEEYTTEVDWFTDLITDLLGEHWQPVTGNEKNLHINKISAKKTVDFNLEGIKREMGPYYDLIIHENNAFVGRTIEMIPKNCSKAVGIAAVIRAFDIPWEDTVIFGDSNNDLSMFEYAATKVAMGNAPEQIKNMADYVTGDMFHYGIRDGLRHLGLV